MSYLRYLHLNFWINEYEMVNSSSIPSLARTLALVLFHWAPHTLRYISATILAPHRLLTRSPQISTNVNVDKQPHALHDTTQFKTQMIVLIWECHGIFQKKKKEKS